MLPWLRRPYPIDLSWRNAVVMALTFGGIIAAFLFVFSPFGLVALSVTLRLQVAFGYGAVTAVAMIILRALMLLVLPKSFEENPFAENQWTVLHQLRTAIANVSFIAVGNWAYTVWLGYTSADLDGLFTALGYTIVTGTLPIVLHALYSERLLSNRYRQQAEALSRAALQRHDSPSPPPLATSSPAKITLVGAAASEVLRLPPEALLWAAAADNYVEVFWLSNGRLSKTLLRQTLANLASQLSTHPQFMRVHRGYLVNLAQVERFEGNAQGYRLYFTSVPESVPVSRAYTAAVRQWAPVAANA